MEKCVIVGSSSWLVMCPSIISAEGHRQAVREERQEMSEYTHSHVTDMHEGNTEAVVSCIQCYDQQGFCTGGTQMGPLLGLNESPRGGVEPTDIMNQTEPSGNSALRYPACHSPLWRGAPWATGDAD